jgi:hypothetical protein
MLTLINRLFEPFQISSFIIPIWLMIFSFKQYICKLNNSIFLQYLLTDIHDQLHILILWQLKNTFKKFNFLNFYTQILPIYLWFKKRYSCRNEIFFYYQFIYRIILDYIVIFINILILISILNIIKL